MFLKNSLKSTYRSPIKSLLLILILAITSFVWQLGVSTWMDIDNFLEQCNEMYVTLGRLEYVGGNFYQEYMEDEDVLESIDFDTILELNAADSVILAETSKEYFGRVSGYERTDMFSQVYDEVVLVVTGAIEIDEENHIYQVRSKDVLFSDKNLFGKTILLSVEDMTLESDKDYVIYAKKQNLSRVLFNVKLMDYQPLGSDKVIQGCYELDEGENIPNDYLLIAESLLAKQNGVVINPTGNLESIFLFHQDLLFLEEGRSFSAEEYQDSEKVCIVNGILSDRLGLGLGDEIELSWINEGGTDLWADYWPETGFSETEKFKIVGITNKLNEANYQVFVPDSDLFHSNHIAGDHEILRVVLDNQKATEYVELINDQLGNQLKFSLYDQGYASTAGAYVSIQNIAKLIVFSVSILCLASVFLIGYGCVYRRSDISGVMLKLGCKRNQIVRYYCYSGMYLALVGIIIGTIASLLARNHVFEWVQEVSKEKTELDLRFSDFSYAMQRKAVEFKPTPGVDHFVLRGVILFFICFLIILAFALKVSQFEKKGQRQIRRQVDIKIRRHGYGSSSFGFSMRQILRSRFRTIGILLLGISISIFGGVILGAYNTSSSNLNKLMTEEEIQGYLADYKGYINRMLLLNVDDLEKLYMLDGFDQITASTYEPCVYWGKSQTKNGDRVEIDPLPTLETEADSMLWNRRIVNSPVIYYATDLDMLPKFLYQKDVKTEFLEGFDESFLREEYLGELYGMISYQMAEREGLELGDSFTIVCDRRRYLLQGFCDYEIKVVGLYENNTNYDDIICQLDAMVETDFIRGGINSSDEKMFVGNDPIQFSLHAITFRLDGVQNITKAKESLVEVGFEEVETAGMNRKYVLLEDGVPLSNLNNFIIQDQYTRVLVILMVILSIVANVFISSSLIRNKKNEIGVMMGMGATKAQVYKAFVTEIVLVYVIGNILGAALLEVFVLDLNNMHYLFFAGAMICFAVGSSYALFKASSNKLIENMRDVEE